MKKILKIIVMVLVLSFSIPALTACNDARMIQYNIAQRSDKFDTYRRVTVINLRSDKVLLEIEGYISIQNTDGNELAVIILTGRDEYKMHYVYLASEVVYLVEQLENTSTDPYHWDIRIHAIWPEFI